MRAIEIAGGGLAGLTLGIALRQQGVPVQVTEAGSYPRHRVCGEFISGRGLEVLERLGLTKLLQSCGAHRAETAAFFSGRQTSGLRRLPVAAIALSRYDLDRLLAEDFRARGGLLREHRRTTHFGEGVVRATGRRIQADVDGWRWFGLKVHASGVVLEADLEMHVMRKGYVGLCRLNEGFTNICGLFRSREAVPDLARNWKAWLKGEEGSVLHERMSSAAIDESSFCSVAGISLRHMPATSSAECNIGDAISMIPPVTGNGMSLAFESAELASGPLVRYAKGEQSWEAARGLVAEACDAAFQQRFGWGVFVQGAMMRPLTAQLLIKTAAVVPGIWPALFSRTRG